MRTPALSAFQTGGGAMGARMRAFDWASTPLGPLAEWSSALRITVDQMLASKFPACLFWGTDLIAVYNDGYAPMLGRKPEALGQPMRTTWAEVWPQLQPIAEKALAGESTFIENYLVEIDRNGQPEACYFTFNYGPVFDEHGAVVGMLDTVMETTQQVLAERRSREERDRQHHLLRQMPGFVAVLAGPAHVFEYVNEAYVTISGPRHFIGRTVREVFPELHDQGFYDMLDQVYASGQPIRAHALPIVLDREGGHRFIDLLYEPIRNAEGQVQGIFVGGYDVTDRMQAEAELRASETRLRTLNTHLEQRVIERTLARGRSWQVTPELLSVVSANGFFETVNPAWTKALGWTEAELTSAPFRDFVHPDDLAATLAAWADVNVQRQPVLRFENRYRTRTGEWRWLSWMAVHEDDKVYCISRDITAEKQHAAALAEAQEALRQSQKMEAVGQLTGGIAHDFNNLLASISGSLQVLQMRLKAGQTDGIGHYVELGEASVRRAAALTQRLLAFSRRQTLDPKPLDVNRLVHSMVELIARTVGPAVQVTVDGATGLWPIRVDPSQLENALLNLCINARDAMPAGGRLTLVTRNDTLDAQAAAARELPPGDYVSLCVIDDGTGMPPEVVRRVFDPFFTTKPIGQGTGLGLSMVYGFVRQSGGQVEVDSQTGRGTTLCLHLPRHQGAATPDTAIAAAPAPGTGQGETLLLIEDENTVRELLAEVLQEAGYTVLMAKDGPSGLRLLQAAGHIDLLITDVGLPGGMNGRQVADAGRALRPRLQVLFITGYAESAAVGNGLMEDGMEVMTKPFDIVALMARVRAMLDAPLSR